MYVCNSLFAPTCNCEVKETLLVVPAGLFRLRPLFVRHVGEHVLEEERLELGAGERRVTLARRVVEQRVDAQNSPCVDKQRVDQLHMNLVAKYSKKIETARYKKCTDVNKTLTMTASKRTNFK